jgi:PAS domain S-box-containing protein
MTTHPAHTDDITLAGAGTMGALMRGFDWVASPLGPVEHWPPCLRSAVNLCLHSQFPMVIFWGPELRVLYNDAYRVILVDKHPTALGQPAQQIFPEVWDTIRPLLHGVVHSGQATAAHDLLLPLVSEGVPHERYFSFSYSPIVDEQGAVRGVFCPVTETTERVLGERRERALRAAAEAARDQVTQVIESMTDSFVAFDRQWRITALNASGAAAMHHRREDLLGKVYWEEFPPTRETNLYPEFQRAMTARVPVVFESYYPPWACWYEVHAYPAAGGGLAVFFCDITARKAAETALTESERLWRTVAEALPALVWMSRPDGFLDYYNQRWADTTGLTVEELTGQYGYEAAWHPEDLPGIRATWNDALRTGQPYAYEGRLRCADGSYRWHLIRGFPLRDADGRLQRWFGANVDVEEQKRTALALQQSEERFRAAQEASLDAFTILRSVRDTHGEIVDFVWEYVNPRAAQLLRRPSEALVGQRLLHMLPGNQTRSALFADYVRVVETGEPYDRELSYEADGITGWFRNMTVKLRDGVANCFSDITARKQMEEALRLNEERFRVALQDSPITVFQHDRELRYTWIYNPTPGFTDERALGKTDAELLTPEYAEPLMALKRQVVDNGMSIRTVVKTADNSPIRYHDQIMEPLRDTQGHIIGLTCAAVDITARTQLELQLQEAHQRLQLHLENTPLAVIEWDNEFHVRQWSARAEQMFGWTAEEVRDKCFTDWQFVAEEDQEHASTKLQELITGNGPPNGKHYYIQENCNYTKDGRVLDCVWYNSWLYDDAGKLVSTLSFVQDVTARKQAEAEQEALLVELQRINDELQQFAHIVSHDLGEPLRTMRNFVQLLAQRTKGKLNGDAEEYMAFVTDAAQRMQQMLTDLLAYTRAGQTPEFQTVDCEAVLTRVLDALQARITECHAVITHDPLPTIPGDATRIGQVLQNLIGNALKFCEEKPPRIHLSASKEDHHWKFSVRDNGIGIDPQQTNKLFQVFQRVHGKEYAGTGIGLAICKKIVEQHGGKIWVESKPDEGSLFYFTISDMGGGGENSVLTWSRPHDCSLPSP